MLLARLDGVMVEALGSAWVAFSPASGETALLNNECAAILEVLEAGPASMHKLCHALATDCGMPVDDLVAIVEAQQQALVEAGLVEIVAAA